MDHRAGARPAPTGGIYDHRAGARPAPTMFCNDFFLTIGGKWFI